jgi:hypothetical protein
VTTATEAVERVVAHEPRFAGIRPYDTGLIGQASWFTVQPGSGVGAFIVTIRVGWGDCQAGCIEEHGWIYAVAPDGAVTLVSETGEPIPPPAWPSPITGGATGIAGLITAGPVCPVETAPPDPDCAARPVADANVVIRDGDGMEVARAVTDADGAFLVALPAGDYIVEPQPVDGLLGIAAAQPATVVEGGTAEIALEYDTGIR